MTSAESKIDNWTIEKVCEDIECHIRVHLSGSTWIDYEVRDYHPECISVSEDVETKTPFITWKNSWNEPTSNIEEAEPFLKGSIKWDGCSHNTFAPGDNSGYIHGCGREDMIRLGKLFDVLFDIAIELMPDHKEYLT